MGTANANATTTVSGLRGGSLASRAIVKLLPIAMRCERRRFPKDNDREEAQDESGGAAEGKQGDVGEVQELRKQTREARANQPTDGKGELCGNLEAADARRVRLELRVLDDECVAHDAGYHLPEGDNELLDGNHRECGMISDHT